MINGGNKNQQVFDYNTNMRIILTHEQADFDAIASLLAAHLLDEKALPVLPHRMNRNVRAFITIYGAELMFMEARDLPGEPIESVTLVDTQSMVTLKGFNSKTKVRAIDHHPLREDLPDEWQVSLVDTGATTTILVETLRELNHELSTVQATLLLLGIYEDTGSLTYSSTTPRDLQVAAFLLAQGASLRIAGDFLNHPLSLPQQRLYDELRQSAKTLKVHGHSVVICSGDAKEINEELSSIAHKLRDLLDPDALIVLVTTRGGVQMIARSTSEHIDVGKIAGHFGGGGHDRAAAVLVKDLPLPAVERELILKLPDFVRPAITVAQIMSRGLQVLTPDTPAEVAAERMARYGYEGYPVVDDGKVVGLLTRRAVDRTLSHKMNLVAARIMDAGNHVVQTTDSLEHLQRLMTDTGWGQIPVVQPDTQQIIGIVTRTDLLKILTQSDRGLGVSNLTTRLEAALPAARLALLRAVAQKAHDQHLAVYIVGGFVRDLLLEHPSLDFDLVVEADSTGGDAIGLAHSLAEQYGGRVTAHAQFGTAKWYLEQSLGLKNHVLNRQDGGNQVEISALDLPPFIDLITARTEFYTYPTALPTVERGSIKLDLHRRDFTINTLALRLDGRHYGDLHDYWGGMNDLRQKLVRVLHSLSFVDDPTRILRAVRFEQRFEFKIEERTLELLFEAREMLARVTGDRIRHEIDHILNEPRIIFMIDRLAELDLLTAIHPGLVWDEWLKERFKMIPVGDPEDDWNADLMPVNSRPEWPEYRRRVLYTLWLMRMPMAELRSLGDRLHYPHNIAAQINAAGKLWRKLPELYAAKPSQIVSVMDEMPYLAVFACYLAYYDTPLSQLVYSYLTVWRYQVPNYTGDDIRQRGIPPNPVYKEILGCLRNAWLDGEITTNEEEKNLFESLIEKATQGKSAG
jgi:tRNA nucleotidyltransferase (CCA-adding enzyme)